MASYLVHKPLAPSGVCSCALARLVRPTFIIHPREPYLPISARQYLRACQVRFRPLKGLTVLCALTGYRLASNAEQWVVDALSRAARGQDDVFSDASAFRRVIREHLQSPQQRSMSVQMSQTASSSPSESKTRLRGVRVLDPKPIAVEASTAIQLPASTSVEKTTHYLVIDAGQVAGDSLCTCVMVCCVHDPDALALAVRRRGEDGLLISRSTGKCLGRLSEHDKRASPGDLAVFFSGVATHQLSLLGASPFYLHLMTERDVASQPKPSSPGLIEAIRSIRRGAVEFPNEGFETKTCELGQVPVYCTVQPITVGSGRTAVHYADVQFHTTYGHNGPMTFTGCRVEGELTGDQVYV